MKNFGLIIALIGFLPYHLASQTFFNSFELTTNLTSFKQIISINGLFIFICLSGLLILARFNFKTLFHRLNKFNLARLLRTKVNILQMFSYLFIFTAIIASFTVVLTGMIGGAIPVGIIGFIIGSVALYKSFQSKPDSFHYQTFAIVISIAAFSIIIGVDILRVEGDIDRMNTVFKFYLQAWILFSISSGFMTSIETVISSNFCANLPAETTIVLSCSESAIILIFIVYSVFHITLLWYKKDYLYLNILWGYPLVFRCPHVTKCKNILDNYDNIIYFLFSIWCGQKNTRYILYTLW